MASLLLVLLKLLINGLFRSHDIDKDAITNTMHYLIGISMQRSIVEDN